MNKYSTINAKHLKNKSFLKTIDFSKEEIHQFIDFAMILKEEKKNNIPHKLLQDKNIALIFEKPSTRTRAAFSVAASDLGAHIDYYGKNELHLGKKETVQDTAKVLGRMYDGIEFRGHEHDDVELLAKFADVPVWNGLTDEWHPTQMIADFLTIKEYFGKIEGKTLSYIGDGRNNIANDLLVTGALLGVNVNIISPESLFPEKNVVDEALSYADVSGATIKITSNIEDTIKHSDVIYTDVWFSMGESSDVIQERINLLLPFQVNESLLEKTDNQEVIVMHCLPAFHNADTEVGRQIEAQYGISEMEITEKVFNSKNAIIFEQAENRLHSIKSIMALTLGDLQGTLFV
ncbi:ornithine carbamoyltransferase [Macrococcoides canis]|uniref:ornithine carbamoyltransferase n=1 Tax=Macrococcoides canis TaxID=1855823 RepID=UPI001F1935F0|nr:ornithine carbamoyltransferase [Macrococcus canis]UJS27887.1 ornithine carbamoyltransferase [Macrococcus canis]UTH00163.1 ornithine carbamoyltransferase [Macrococcus canis]